MEAAITEEAHRHHPSEQALLWTEYRPRLVVFARTFGGAAAVDPEDTAHDIIERAMGRLRQFDGRHAFSTWLYRLARNHCIDVNRKRRRRSEIFRRHALAVHAMQQELRGPQEQLDRSESSATLADLMATLKPDDRQIMFLRYFEELPTAAVSEVMSMPIGTVKYRIHVTLDRLRRGLEERWS